MEIDDTVMYQGRRYLLRGFDPASVSPRQAYLEQARMGNQIAVPLSEVEPVRDEDEPNYC
jgi:hypothetical protein